MSVVRVGRHRWVRVVAIAVLAPALATLIALPLPRAGSLAAGSLYVLAVVAAAAVGGSWAGVGSSFLAFLALNFFFTPPQHTFVVEAPEDIVALLVFLAVSVTVGTLVARVAQQQAAAVRREQETRLVNVLSSDLLSGMSMDEVLQRLAATLCERSELAWVRITLEQDDDPMEIVAGTPPAEPAGEAPTVTVPLEGRGGSWGYLAAGRLPGDASFGRADVEAFATFARQISLGLERLSVDARLHDALSDAERNEARAALFSSVTHDLRTPLASIVAAATTLLQSEVTFDEEQRRDLLTTVYEESERLDRLVGNLLDLARIRAGALTPVRQTVQIDEVVAAVVARLRPQIGDRPVRTVLRADVPELMLDPVQMDQVFTNVLENAARVSPPEGEIAIVRWRSSVQVRVADQGPGIPPEERERVFEAFHRGDRPGGSGLGLSIAQAVVSIHGGRIWIEGAPGGGTAVVIELPVVPVDVAAAYPPER